MARRERPIVDVVSMACSRYIGVRTSPTRFYRDRPGQACCGDSVRRPPIFHPASGTEPSSSSSFCCGRVAQCGSLTACVRTQQDHPGRYFRIDPISKIDGRPIFRFASKEAARWPGPQGTTGRTIRCAGSYRAFLPPPLPPPIEWSGSLVAALPHADLTVGRLAGEGRRFPDPDHLSAPSSVGKRCCQAGPRALGPHSRNFSLPKPVRRVRRTALTCTKWRTMSRH